ncbi:putative Ig domain-containing protein, partial [Paenibacillus sp. GXUN7292]|uniref:putative Ig domain-containing protein n=1 Tax=Paenibacillus sp. GXUN7292 TaxID=3422499 RepID=UPI003D7CEA47
MKNKTSIYIFLSFLLIFSLLPVCPPRIAAAPVLLAPIDGRNSLDMGQSLDYGYMNSRSGEILAASPVNTAPVLAAIGNKTINERDLLTFTASATDFDGDTLTYSLVGAPVGASINSSTGEFTWTPTEAQGPGSYTFAVRVNDGALNAEEQITVTVNEVNTAPVLAAIGNKTVDEETLLTFTAIATDADLPANTLTYSL